MAAAVLLCYGKTPHNQTSDNFENSNSRKAAAAKEEKRILSFFHCCYQQ